MAKSQSFLTKKYGPLPAWGWAAVGVGGFLAYRYYQANKAAGGDQSQPGGWSGQPTGAPGGAGGRHRRRHR